MENISSWDWLDNFRVSSATFDHISWYRMHSMRTLSYRKQYLLKTMWQSHCGNWLCWQNICRTVAHLFGIGWSTVCEVIHETRAAIVKHPLPKYIHFPTNSSSSCIDRFEVHGIYLSAVVLLMAPTQIATTVKACVTMLDFCRSRHMLDTATSLMP